MKKRLRNETESKLNGNIHQIVMLFLLIQYHY